MFEKYSRNERKSIQYNNHNDQSIYYRFIDPIFSPDIREFLIEFTVRFPKYYLALERNFGIRYFDICDKSISGKRKKLIFQTKNYSAYYG